MGYDSSPINFLKCQCTFWRTSFLKTLFFGWPKMQSKRGCTLPPEWLRNHWECTYGKVDALVGKNFGTFLVKISTPGIFHLIWRGVFNDLSAKVGAMDRAQVLLIGLAVGVILRQKADYSWSKPPNHNEHAEGRTSEKIN